MRRSLYKIEFNKVLKGENHLTYRLDPDFLRSMGTEQPQPIEVHVDVNVQRAESMFQVNVSLKGSIGLTCDVCLDDFNYPVHGQFGFIIRVSESEKYDDDEIIYITPETIDFDLSQFLYDSLMLSIPLRKVCTDAGKECNPVVLAKLNEMNSPSDETEKDPTDPRWDKLKGII